MSSNVSPIRPANRAFVAGSADERRKRFCALFNDSFACSLDQNEMNRMLDLISMHPKTPGNWYSQVPEHIEVSYMDLGDGTSSTFLFCSIDNPAGERRRMLVVLDYGDDGKVDVVACQYSPEIAKRMPWVGV